MPFESIVGNGENASIQHFVIFQLFSNPRKVDLDHLNRFCEQQRISLLSANAFSLDNAKILTAGLILSLLIRTQEALVDSVD